MRLNKIIKDRLVTELKSGTSVPETANKLGIPYNQVYQYARRLKRKVKMRAPSGKLLAESQTAPIPQLAGVAYGALSQTQSGQGIASELAIVDRLLADLVQLRLTILNRIP